LDNQPQGTIVRVKLPLVSEKNTELF
jgi:hypothetical protein